MKQNKNMVETDGITFEFSDAITAFKFDQQNRTSPDFHALSHAMKAVDIIAEFKDKHVFVEICNKPHENTDVLVNELKYKYRDSFLYRYAEQKVDKPIEFICLINKADAVMIQKLHQKLMRGMPIPKIEKWQRHFVEKCIVVNLEMWNKRYSRWRAERIKKTKR